MSEQDSTPGSPPYELRRTNPSSYPEDDETQATESDLHYYANNPGSSTGGPGMAPAGGSVQGSTAPSTSTFSTPLFKDCTNTVHQMHDLLLQLLSNPDEFSAAIDYYKRKTTTSTLTAFHAEYDRATEVGSTWNGGEEENVPVPFVVFAMDAEVVLPQAHTASQLFGYEREGGIELEAASGMIGLCQLFLRWLALMPGGDHTNIIDPPGLTVMRIAGGRYRVTAAHRVVWTWNNEFLTDPTSSPKRKQDELHFGDLVTMTIVDVFETDCDGKLLSYCPTFDNRAIRKTDQRVERIRKGSTKIKNQMNIVANSQAALTVNKAASMLGRFSMKAAVTVKDTVQKKLEEDRRKREAANAASPTDVKNSHAFEQALNAVEAGTSKGKKSGDNYISDGESNSADNRQ